MVMKKYVSELSFTLARVFNKCLKESCFPGCWKISSVVPVFKNVGSIAKNCCPVSLLSVIRKLSEKLVNNRLFNHFEKCGLLSDFQYSFRSSRSTTGDASDRNARAFNRSGASRALALDTSKTWDRLWHACRFQKRKSYGIYGQVSGLILSFLGNRY